MGVIYRAKQLSLGRTVAVKMLLLGRYSSAESIDRFRREAHSAASLRHPNIVAIYEVGECEGQHFFSMEFVDGPSLGAISRQGPLKPRRAAEYAKAIAEAIDYAHTQGVLHRDLKPSNVLIDPFDQVRITDFGLAKKLDGSSDLTLTGQMIGSPNYLSPEQAAGRHPEVGPTSDVYAIGALLYELLTGRPPFMAESLAETLVRIQTAEPVSLRALNSRIPADLETICLKCLQKQSESRYGSAKSLAEDLGRFLAGQPVLARPATRLVRTLRWARREPKLAGMLMATIGTVAALVATLATSNIRIRSAQRQTAAKAEESRQRLVRLNVAAGNKLVEEGDSFGSLLWFVEALRFEQDGGKREEVHRRRIASVLRQTPVLAHCWFHESEAITGEFSRDGSRILTTCADGTVSLSDATSGNLAAPIIKTAAPLVFGHLMPNGSNIVTVSDNRLQFWRLADGSPVGENFPTPPLEYDAADMTQNGCWFLSPVMGGAQLFDASNCEPVGRMIPCPHPLTKVQFNADASRAVGIGKSREAYVWEIPSGKLIMTSPAQEHEIRLVAFRPDGRRVATVSGMRDLCVWDVPSGALAWRVFSTGDDLYDCQFSPNGRWLVTGSWNGAARMFDGETGAPLGDSMRHRGGILRVRPNADGSLLATGSWDNTARLWFPTNGRPASVALPHAHGVTQLAFSPNAERLLTASEGYTARLWNFSTKSSARLVLFHGQTVSSGSFSPDGTRILTCSDDHRACIWDRRNGALLHCFQLPEALRIGRFSVDGQRVVVGASQGQFQIGEVSTGHVVQSLNHTGGLLDVELSPDGRRVASCGDDGTARIWDVASGELLVPALQHGGRLFRVTFSPDGRWLATASHDGTARLWNARTGEALAPPLVQPYPLQDVEFASDSRRIITASGEGNPICLAQIWDVATGQAIGLPLSHNLTIATAMFSHDGRLVATASSDLSAQIWNAATGQRTVPPLRHASVVTSAKFSPDDQLLLTTSSDFTARVWDAATGEAVTPPLVHAAQVPFGAWSPDGNEVLTCSYDGTACVWDIRPTSAPFSELKRQAELLSAQRLHEATGAVPLTTSELKQRWDSRPEK
jgi:WD40 repeat protein